MFMYIVILEVFQDSAANNSPYNVNYSIKMSPIEPGAGCPFKETTMTSMTLLPDTTSVKKHTKLAVVLQVVWYNDLYGGMKLVYINVNIEIF